MRIKVEKKYYAEFQEGTPLVVACEYGSLKDVEALIKMHNDVNGRETFTCQFVNGPLGIEFGDGLLQDEMFSFIPFNFNAGSKYDPHSQVAIAT